jgi:general secretion pathway protein E
VLARLDDAGGLMLRLRQGASPEVLAEMRRHTGLPMRAELLSAEDFEAALAAEYAEAEGGSLLSDGLGDSAELTSLMQDSQRIQDLLESDDDAPIIRLINTIFMQALRDGASDIHIERFEERSAVRFASMASSRMSLSRRAPCMRPWPRASRSWRRWTSPRSVCRRMAASP